jgi:integrase
VFGRSGETALDARALARRAAKAWKELEPISLHECRHTFASLMIAAAVNAKALSTWMGHSSITITLDLYGHLMPGNEEEGAALLDAYLERANTAARLAQLAPAS